MTDIAPPPQVSTPAYSGPERRNRHRERYLCDNINRRFAEGSETMKALRAELEENTATTQRVDANTAELVDLLQSFKGAFAVFDLIGRAARPLGYIAAAGTALWGLFVALKGGGAPK
ncbi:hypothetical protein MCEMIEM13_01535 [Comamonadaceae bacterium]